MGRGLGIPHPLAYTRYQPTSKAERVARATRWRSSSCSSRGGKAGRRRGDSDEQAHCGYVARGVAVWRMTGVWLTPPSWCGCELGAGRTMSFSQRASPTIPANARLRPMRSRWPLSTFAAHCAQLGMGLGLGLWPVGSPDYTDLRPPNRAP
jgi:hypothetical protein